MAEKTRKEHLEWCKQRANEYIDIGDLTQAFASMASDLGKHQETVGHMGITLGMSMMISGGLNSEDEMRKFINDFN
jgi:hypothetical protein